MFHIYNIMAFKSFRVKRRLRGTRKHAHSCNREHEKNRIIATFMEMLNTVKVYHWNTYSYAEHKATDELYEKLNEHVDTFVETMLGKRGERLTTLRGKVPMVTKDVADFKDRIFAYRHFLKGLGRCFSGDTDLMNIRDEILGDLNQFLYLMTFNK